MRVTPQVVQQEFIGLHVRVAGSPHRGYVGIEGRVVDETRNTLVIVDEKGRKTVVKEAAVFHFTMPDGTIVEIDGKVIVGRPEDRVKKPVRRRW